MSTFTADKARHEVICQHKVMHGFRGMTANTKKKRHWTPVNRGDGGVMGINIVHDVVALNT